jgi:hypothetical protein
MKQELLDWLRKQRDHNKKLSDAQDTKHLVIAVEFSSKVSAYNEVIKWVEENGND